MKMTLFGVNIAAQNHDNGPRIYEQIFDYLIKLRQPVKVHGDRHALINEAKHLGKDQIIVGRISTFIMLDGNARWFDADNSKAVTEENRNLIIIPKQYHPNLKESYFYFDLTTHTMCLVEKFGNEGIGPKLAKKLFDVLFDNPKVVEEFGIVSATLIPYPGSVAKLLKKPGLFEVHLKITPPNVDGGDYDVELAERLKKMKARSYEELVQSSRGVKLNPDEELTAHAELAGKSGQVNVKYIDTSGHVHSESTADKPYIKPFVIDKLASTLEQFFVKAREFLNGLRAH